MALVGVCIRNHKPNAWRLLAEHFEGNRDDAGNWRYMPGKRNPDQLAYRELSQSKRIANPQIGPIPKDNASDDTVFPNADFYSLEHWHTLAIVPALASECCCLVATPVKLKVGTHGRIPDR